MCWIQWKTSNTSVKAGLVEVKLKRKIYYKNNHKREFVDPKKSYCNGHPSYEDFYTREDYVEHFRLEDEEGYDSLFGGEYAIDEVFEQLASLNTAGAVHNIIDEVNDQEAEAFDAELYYKKNDPVAEFHFDYDRSTCLTEKYPEVAADESDCQELSFAPGEGKYPSDILLDKS